MQGESEQSANKGQRSRSDPRNRRLPGPFLFRGDRLPGRHHLAERLIEHPRLPSLGSAGAAFLVVLLHLERRRIAGKKGQSMRCLQSTALVMLTFSILTGCAGPLFSDTTEMAYHCNEINGTACRYGAAQGIGIFGFGLDQVSINAAIEAGHLTKVITTSEVRSYGLISMAKVTVYGE